MNAALTRSQKKWNLPAAALQSSTGPPRGCPPLPPVTPELPSRHDNNGDLVQYSVFTEATNYLPLPEPPYHDNNCCFQGHVATNSTLR
jgi:hypothetical protein